MAPSEKKWVVIFSVVILSVTTVPYLIGFFQGGSGWQFTGFFMGVEDGNSYIAKMLLGSEGAWLFKTPYTSYPQRGFLAFLPYMLLGKLASPPGQHAQLVALFQLFRWAGGFLMITATYLFVGYFFVEPKLRKLGTMVAVLGGGVGWLALLGFQGIWGGRLPLEFYSPETFGFLSLFTLPHLSMARGLLLIGILAYWQGFTTECSSKKMILNGSLWIILGLMQPLTVTAGWLVIGVDLAIRMFIFRKTGISRLIRQKGFLNGAVMGLCSAPIIIYTVFSFSTDPFLKIWSAQNIILSPPPGDYLLAYFVLLPLIFLGARRIIFEKGVEIWVIFAWFVLLPLLAYFPYNLQRRLPEGTWVALVIFAIFGLQSLSPKFMRAGLSLLLLSCLSSIMILTGSLFTVLQTRPPVFRPADETSAFLFLGERVDGFPIVLAAYETSNSLPAWAPVRTIIGHGPESVHLTETQNEVKLFFTPAISDEERKNIIDKHVVRYLIWGQAERELGSWNPASWPALDMIYQNTTFQIFAVNP